MNTDTFDILSPEKSIALKASAGSGKTFNLSLRVVNLLLEGIEPDRILCLTFTNKATNEMYERIISTLTYLARDLSEVEIQDSKPPTPHPELQTPRDEALMLAEYWMQKERGKDRTEVLTLLKERAMGIHKGIVREISRLRVSTIDSFFNSILRLFPFEAGVLPDFRTITESEEEEIYKKAYDEFIAGVHSDSYMRGLLTNLVLLSGSAELSPFRVLDGYFKELLSIRTEIEGRREKSQVEAEVKHRISEYQDISGKNIRISGYQQRAKEKDQVEVEGKVKAKGEGRGGENQVEVEVEAKAKSRGQRAEGRGQRAEGRGLLEEFDVLRGLEARVKAAAVSLTGKMRSLYPGLGKQALSELKRYEESSLKKLSTLTSLTKEKYTEYRYFSSIDYMPEIQDAFDGLRGLMRDYFRQKSRLFQRTTLFLFLRFLQFPDRKKQNLNVLSFHDVTRLCYNLLIGSGLMMETPDYFYFRLDSRIEHLLIDEFQDTSVIQWRILKPIADELTSGIGQKDRAGSLFYVGDPKQSIYRFRGGESRLFDAVLAQYPEKLKPLSLGRNFRSGRVIVDFVNRVFSDVSSHYRYGYEDQEPTVDEEGYVELRFISSKGRAAADRDSVRELKMQTVLSFMDTLLSRGILPGDIAVLCQKNRTCEEYAELLRSQGYDVLTETSESLMAQPPVKAVMNLLRCLSDPEQVVYLLGFLFPVEGLLDEEEIDQLFKRCPLWNDIHTVLPGISERLKQLQRVSGLIPVNRVLERIIEEFDLYRVFNHDPNLLYLIGMAGSEEIKDSLSIEEFIAFMKSRSSIKALIPAGVSENSVRLMTVHKAKGLEFPYVILPELERMMSFDARNNPLIIDHDEEMAIKGLYLSENKGVAALLPELDDVRAGEEERIKTDCLNYLYVALTRAKHGLMVVAGRSEGSDSQRISDILYSVIEDELNTRGKRQVEAEGKRQVEVEGKAKAKGEGRRGKRQVEVEAEVEAKGEGERAEVSIYKVGSIPDGERRPAERTAAPACFSSFAGFGAPLKDMIQGTSPPTEAAPLAEEGEMEDPDEYRQRLFGEAFHYAVEMLKDFSVDSIQGALDRVRQRYVAFGEEEIRSIEKRLTLLCTDSGFLELLRGHRRLHETPFVKGDSQYRMDFLVFDGETIRVVDFKTGDAFHSKKSDDLLGTPPGMEGYIKQVRNYLQIIRGYFKERFPVAEGYLVFAGEDSLVLQRVMEEQILVGGKDDGIQ